MSKALVLWGLGLGMILVVCGFFFFDWQYWLLLIYVGLGVPLVYDRRDG
jgi:hypothetical protein